MNEKKKNILLLIAKTAILAVILAVVILNYDRLTNLDVRALVEKAPSVLAAEALIVGVFFLKSLLFVIPASLIYLSVGTAFSPLTAIIISLVGISVEVTATYFLGKFLGSDVVKKLLSKSKNGKKLIEKDVSNKFSVLFLMRFSGLPIDFTSLFLGAASCRYPVYLLSSLAGIMPRVIVLTILGDSIYKYIPRDFVIKAVIVALPVAAMVFVIKFIIDRKKKKDILPEECEKSKIASEKNISASEKK